MRREIKYALMACGAYAAAILVLAVILVMQ